MFPATKLVLVYGFIPGAEDELGNDTEAWAEDGEERHVIGWQPTKITETTAGGGVNYASRSTTHVDLQVPPDFGPYKLRDRIKLPSGLLYEIEGGVLNDGGFHGWHPGDVIRLKRVEG